jgi:hypothetical protein
MGAAAIIPSLFLLLIGMLPVTTASSAETRADISEASERSTLEVIVIDSQTGRAVPYPNLIFQEPPRGTSESDASDSASAVHGLLGSDQGVFHLQLPAGTHRLLVKHVSYDSCAATVELPPGEKVSRTIVLTPRAILLPTLEVESGSSPSSIPDASGVQVLRAEKLGSLPNSRDDPFQMLRVLPGITASDVGSEFHMRGGDIHETLVRVDGMEVRQLFHGRDFGGITGIVPFGMVEKMDVYLGGFPAQYGGRLSGVVDIALRSDALPEKPGSRVKAGIDPVCARVLAETHGEEGSVFLSVREGYLDRVLNAVQDEAVIEPAYRDFLWRAVHRPSAAQSISLNYLRSEDHLFFENGFENHFVNADYLDHFLWSTWKSAGARNIAGEATVFGALSHQLRNLGFSSRDDHRLQRFGARGELSLRASAAHSLKAGAQLEKESGTSTVRSEEMVSIAADGSVATISGFEEEEKIDRLRSAFYVLDDWQPLSPLAMNLGLRLAHDTETQELLWNPRASASVQFGEGWTAHAAWGIYDQPPDSRLSSGPTLRLESERTAWGQHMICGLQRRFGQTKIGIDAYAKDFRKLDGVLERTLQGEVQREFITRGGSTGVETFLQRSTPTSNWWLTYTLARSEWGNGRRTFLRDFDQRHALSFINTFQFARHWDLGTTYTYHTGQPFTLQRWQRESARSVWVLTEGAPNGSRLPDYHRLDLRIRRHFQFENWKMSIYAEGLNLTNHDNVLWYSWIFEPAPDGVQPVRNMRTGMPRLPTLGIEVEF